MRISVNRDDVAYSPNAGRCRVLLDGAPLEDCYTADEERGEAFVLVRDTDGHFVELCDEYGRRLLTERMTGAVRVAFDTGELGHG